MTQQVYLHLFHGRTDLAQNMDDWGTDGPVFGPFDGIHTTYATDIKLVTDGDSVGDLTVVGGCVYYNGVYYGDWVAGTDPGGRAIEQFDQDKATPSGE